MTPEAIIFNHVMSNLPESDDQAAEIVNALTRLVYKNPDKASEMATALLTTPGVRERAKEDLANYFRGRKL